MVQYKQCVSSLSVNSPEMTSEFFTTFDCSIFLKVSVLKRRESTPCDVTRRNDTSLITLQPGVCSSETA